MPFVSSVCRKLLSGPIFCRFLNNEKLYIEAFIDRMSMNEFSIGVQLLIQGFSVWGVRDVQNGGRRRSFLNEFPMSALAECS